MSGFSFLEEWPALQQLSPAAPVNGTRGRQGLPPGGPAEPILPSNLRKHVVKCSSAMAGATWRPAARQGPYVLYGCRSCELPSEARTDTASLHAHKVARQSGSSVWELPGFLPSAPRPTPRGYAPPYHRRRNPPPELTPQPDHLGIERPHHLSNAEGWIESKRSPRPTADPAPRVSQRRPRATSAAYGPGLLQMTAYLIRRRDQTGLGDRLYLEPLARLRNLADLWRLRSDSATQNAGSS